MALTINKAYVLTGPELMVLAAAKGIGTLFGVSGAKPGTGEEQVIDAVHHLYQQGILKNSGSEAFVLRGDLKEILKSVSEATGTLLFRDYTQEGSVWKAVYAGAGLAGVEQVYAGTVKPYSGMDTFRLYGFAPEELPLYLENGSGENEVSYRFMLDEENVINQILGRDKVLRQNEIERLGNLKQMFEFVVPGTEHVEQRIARMQTREGERILYFEEGKGIRAFTGKDAPVEYVMKKLKEVEAHGIG